MMDSIKLWLFLTTWTLLLLIYWLHKRQVNFPPGPWNLPIVGHLPWIDPKAPYITLTELSQKFGPLYALCFGKIYTVVVTDVKLMKKILMKDETAIRPALHLFKCMSKFKGIFFSQEELYKDQRKFLQHFLKTVGASKFSQNRNRLQNHITKEALDFVQYLQSKGDQVVIHPAEVLTHNVASISSLLFLDASWPRDDKNWNTLLHYLDEIPRIVTLAGPLNFLPFLRFLPRYKKELSVLKSAVEELLISFKALIDKKKQTFQDGDSITNLIDAFFAERSKCKLASKKFYTDVQLGYLINDMLIAGIETLVVSLSWYILYLALHQDVQKKVHQELMDVLDEEEPNLDHLSLLPYLEATMAEVARIRTVVPLGGPHYASQDVMVEQYKIPKGAMIFALTWAVHMDKSVWVDPEVFRPERFIDVEGKFFKPENFVPFLVGKRMCPGEELAQMIMFIFIANIFTYFKVECEGADTVDLDGNCGTILAPKPHKIIFTKL